MIVEICCSKLNEKVKSIMGEKERIANKICHKLEITQNIFLLKTVIVENSVTLYKLFPYI